MRRIVVALLVGAVVLGLSGCGWLRAGSVSHTKPNGFVLRGYVAVAGAASGSPGTPCQVPRVSIQANDRVLVTDPPGHTLASGVLGAGVLAATGSAYQCDFPFEIPAVPGGHTSYEIAVADRPAVSFPATELRQDKTAVIPVQ